ncbi:MAG TPA: hypothetical protein VFY54_07190, partial [Rubrobacter sp.]|nr:hypothetical protein [Rubrobacter sp.]
TPAQMEAMRKAYPDFVMPGYAMRIDDDGMFSFVPWHQATYGGVMDPDRPQDFRPRRQFQGEVSWDVKPIKKRTPQERLESLANSFMADVQKHGRIPGLDDEKTRELVGEAWRAGTPMTAEDVRAAAATLLTQAENKFEESERKKVVRTSPTD